jgi:hypothetical protein
MTTSDEAKPVTDEARPVTDQLEAPESAAPETEDGTTEPADAGEAQHAAEPAEPAAAPAEPAEAAVGESVAPGTEVAEVAETTPTTAEPAEPAESVEPADAAAPAEPAEPADAPSTAEPARKRRPALRTVLRWTTATVLCLGLGTGTAFAVMAPNRTDIPGLQTPLDGRYTYPALQLPDLPPGASGPSGSGASKGTPGGTVPHAIADIRLLLLPSAVGGKPDAALPGRKGWVAMSDFAGLFTTSDTVAQLLRENGARQVAATGWTMPDGTHVAVYLVPFRSGTAAKTVSQTMYGNMHLVQAPDMGFTTSDESLTAGTAQNLSAAAKGGKPAVRASLFSLDEITGMLVVTNPKAVNQVDFEQALTLQMELLGG